MIKGCFSGVTKAATAKKSSLPDGYEYNGRLFVRGKQAIVKPSKLQEGIEKAKDDIACIINDTVDSLTRTKHSVSEIELSVSFNAKGEFMGFGVGGAASIKIKIVPSDN